MRSLKVVKGISRNSIVTHSNKIAEARYVLSEQEQKIILAMVSMIEPDDKDFSAYRIYQKDLADIVGMDIKSSVREFDKITDRLMTRILKIPQEDGSLLKTHWVSDVIFKDGFLEVFFSKNLKPYLLRLKNQFTTYKLSVVVQFSGKYTIRIYQLLQENAYKKSFVIELSKLRDILGLDKKKYVKFYEFRRWVLDKAKKEMTAKDSETGLFKSDIGFDIKTIRTGRSITHLEFRITKQKTESSTVKKQLKNNNQEQPKTQEIKEMLSIGISETNAFLYLEKYGEEYILEKLQVLAEAQQIKEIKSSSGYFVKALSENWKSEKSQQKAKENKRRKKDQEKQQLARTKLVKNDLEKKFRLEEKENFLKPLLDKQEKKLLAEARKENPEIAELMKDLDSPFCGAFIVSKIPDYEKNKAKFINSELEKLGLIKKGETEKTKK